MSKHTPSPWRVADIKEYPQNSGKNTLVVSGKVIVAQSYAPTLGEAEANAKLIAASPKMYKALKELLQPDNVLTKKGIVMAAKAIAKAEEI